MANDERQNNNLQAVREAVENFFEKDKLKHKPFDERNVASAIYSLDVKFGHVTVFFHAYKDRLIIHSILPLNADEEERVKVGEFLLRANYGLKVGGFDFDFDDGEISYRVSIYCGDDDFVPPTYEQIAFVVFIGMMMIERYGNALIKVMFGLVEPSDAIESVESDD